MKGVNRREFMKLSAGGLGFLALDGLGFGKASAATDQVLNAHIPSALNSIDPAHEISTGDEGRVSILLNNALMRYAAGERFKLIPDLATGYEVSEGGRVYTFHLRENVKWHKGYGTFSARDVKYSVERILDPATKSRNARIFGLVGRVEAVDPMTVRFHLKTPSAIFPHKVATFRAGFLLSEAAGKELGTDVGKKIVGTGPFWLEKAVLDQELILRRNEEFFGERPRLEKIVFKIIREPSTANLAFERRRLDLIDVNDRESIERYQHNPDYRFLVGTASTGLFLITFNSKRPPFDNKTVRKAFQYAIDKKPIVQAVYGPRGRVIDTVVPPGVEGWTDDVPKYPYDPDKAAEMLAKAGFPKGLTCTLTVPTSYQREAVLLQSQLKRAGITLKLDMIDRPTWFRSLGGTGHELLWNAHFRAPVADAFLFVSYHSANMAPRGINCAMYDGVDDLIDRARVTFDEEERAKIYATAIRRIADDSPAIPIVQELNTFVAQKYVKNIDTFRVPENAPVLERAYIEK
ncbi:MAG: ABC transporter substrate-binding protein [Deltaproteobacteria bacterium]|nr:ABC transporter substrate-binding protein [Deltaproteobacteria bacterium]MBW2120418.1 ABC transporter substrate-binding protein [Deltaproteobacteria bacterium]